MIVLLSLLSLAEALDCDFRPKHMPNGEWDNVPLNLRPLALTSSPNSFWALYQEGEAFSVDVDWYEISTNAFQMIPTEPLLPNTDYQLQSVEYSDVKFAYLKTGEQMDGTPPSTPSLLSVDRETSSSDWGDTDMMVFAFAEVDADVQFAFVELSADDTFSAPHQVWIPTYVYGEQIDLGVGEGLCDTTVSASILDTHHYVKITLYDWAGNRSEPLFIDTQYEQSLRRKVGCTTNATDIVWLGGLMVFGLRRKS